MLIARRGACSDCSMLSQSGRSIPNPTKSSIYILWMPRGFISRSTINSFPSPKEVSSGKKFGAGSFLGPGLVICLGPSRCLRLLRLLGHKLSPKLHRTRLGKAIPQRWVWASLGRCLTWEVGCSIVSRFCGWDGVNGKLLWCLFLLRKFFCWDIFFLLQLPNSLIS